MTGKSLRKELAIRSSDWASRTMATGRRKSMFWQCIEIEMNSSKISLSNPSAWIIATIKTALGFA